MFDYENIEESYSVTNPGEAKHGKSDRDTCIFNGEDPEEYRPWRRWIEAHLITGEDKLKPHHIGPAVYKMLRGEATRSRSTRSRSWP